MDWIFQSNPKYYDLPAAVGELSEIPWSVKQNADQIHVGDTVYLWESGSKAGIVAVSHVVTEPAMLSGEDDRAFHRDKQRFASDELRVRVRIDNVLPQRILRSTLLDDPILKDLLIIRRPQGTNFKLTDEQAAELEKLVRF